MAPYTKVLSALRKNDLTRLCAEFRLSSDGSVVALRNRLKDYLNIHRDTLYRNPRYNALFPRHRKPVRRPRRQSDPSSPPTSPPTSPNASHRSHSHSPARSFDSWHGIDGGVESQDDESLLNNPLLHPPQPPHRVLNQPLQQLLQQPQDSQPFSANPYADYLPPPSNNPANSHQGSLPPGVPPVDGCKYCFFFLCRTPVSCPSFILLDASVLFRTL